MERRKGKVKEVSEAEMRSRLEESPSGKERRRDERLEARLEVEVPLANWEQFRRVYTSNLSQGGLLFSMEAPASIAAALELVLTLPDGKKLTFPSEVRHVARRDGAPEYEVGVQFQLDAARRAELERALSALAQRSR
jgi:hypothetical protein